MPRQLIIYTQHGQHILQVQFVAISHDTFHATEMYHIATFVTMQRLSFILPVSKITKRISLYSEKVIINTNTKLAINDDRLLDLREAL